MAEATGVNRVEVQPEELKFALTWTEEERRSSSAKLENPTGLPVGFEVEATGPDNYEVKPSRGIVPAFGTRSINVTARGSPRVEQCEEEISVRIFDVPPDCREEDIDRVFQGEYYPLSLRNDAISRHALCERVIRVRWVHPENEILFLVNKAVEEVFEQNYGLAQEILGKAIELHPEGYLFTSRALMCHMLDEKEGVKRDLQKAEGQFSLSELDGGTGDHSASSVANCLMSDIVGVPTYTREKLCGKQMIVDRSVAVTENQRLDVQVRFTPSIMLRPDGDVELRVKVDSLWCEVERSQATDNYPDHFLQSLKVVVCPTGKWSESFSEGNGLIDNSPGNELHSLTVQRGRALGVVAGVNLGPSSCVNLQVNRSNTSGTTSSAFGFKPSARDGHAYECEYELRWLEDGSSAQDLCNRRFWKIPKIPEAAKHQVNYPELDQVASFIGTWKVPYATAMDLRNDLAFTISIEAKLPAVRKCKHVTHLFKPPKHEHEVRKLETRRVCVFAIAALKRFTGEGT